MRQAKRKCCDSKRKFSKLTKSLVRYRVSSMQNPGAFFEWENETGSTLEGYLFLLMSALNMAPYAIEIVELDKEFGGKSIAETV
ncbi:hypothetical protein [Paenibacillus sp. ATY16]|uniref:hypothetical protein n=1 Tax=Paenibacillus sp. ATY16 TaxID=1759312 RepID=UPI0013C31FDA|nr:hypothetical protein [Paenibacillus sp. ATY16]